MQTRGGDTRTIVEEHRHLRGELHELELALEAKPQDADRSIWLGELAARIDRLRPALEKHFRHEENLGLFEEIETRYPNAAPQCRELRDEHEQMLDLLDDIRAEAARGGASAATRLHALIEELHRHEERENDLLGIAIEGGPAAAD